LINAFPGLYFRQPMLVGFSPANPSDVYVLERHGKIYRVSADHADNKNFNKELVLDFSEKVGVVDVENGALGFDLHPEFDASQAPAYIYVYYTDVSEQRQINKVSRFDIAAADPDRRLASETVLMALQRNLEGYHNGGSVEFGPDGFLYIALGEASDPKNQQRIDNKLFGGILRIDVDARGGDVSHPIGRRPQQGETDHYYIPNDNPFVGTVDALEEFWALGLRNPFRIAFDSASGRLWAAEVGSTRIEEVNVIEKGGNYQFPYIEGVELTGRPKPERIIGNETAPVYYYEHTAYERAVIGGTVYRGNQYPELQGKYIFADNYSGHVRAIDASGAATDSAGLLAKAAQVAQRGITSVLSTPGGDIYVTVLGKLQEATGQVLKLVSAEQAAVAGDETESNTVAENEAIDAEQIYNTNCGRCHGFAGKGDGPDAAALGVELPDFSSAEYHRQRDDEFLARVIHEGGSALGLNVAMPPWVGILDDREIQALVRYIRDLGGTE
jgi:glucose/arabinose dehydrogenase